MLMQTNFVKTKLVDMCVAKKNKKSCVKFVMKTSSTITVCDFKFMILLYTML
jgi:hypothetical protein